MAEVIPWSLAVAVAKELTMFTTPCRIWPSPHPGWNWPGRKSSTTALMVRLVCRKSGSKRKGNGQRLPFSKPIWTKRIISANGTQHTFCAKTYVIFLSSMILSSPVNSVLFQDFKVLSNALTEFGRWLHCTQCRILPAGPYPPAQLAAGTWQQLKEKSIKRFEACERCRNTSKMC